MTTSLQWDPSRRAAGRRGKLSSVHPLRRALAVVALASVLGGYGWWASGLRPFTRASLAATMLGGVVSMAAGLRALPARGGPREGTARAGHAAWAALFLLLALWEFVFFLQHPRADHPTLSALANALLAERPARALAFAVWLVLGARLARR